MISKTIEFTDYKGKERKMEYFFDINKAEAMEMQFSRAGGLEAHLQKVIDAENEQEIVQFFKEFILKAYGEISDDGLRFIKSEELSTAFSQTPAYSILYMELSTDAKKAVEFVNGVLPSKAEMESN